MPGGIEREFIQLSPVIFENVEQTPGWFCPASRLAMTHIE